MQATSSPTSLRVAIHNTPGKFFFAARTTMIMDITKDMEKIVEPKIMSEEAAWSLEMGVVKMSEACWRVTARGEARSSQERLHIMVGRV